MRSAPVLVASLVCACCAWDEPSAVDSELRGAHGGPEQDGDELGLSVADAVVIGDGAAGDWKPLEFVVRLERDEDETGMVTVNYRTRDGTAVAGRDYKAASGTLTFTPDDTELKITVRVLGDDTFEGDETLGLILEKPKGAAIVRPKGEAVIYNFDPAPDVVTSTVTHVEGDSGNTNATFAFALSRASELAVWCRYLVLPGSATSGTDYVGPEPVVIHFAPGEQLEHLDVPIVGDQEVEVAETFYVVSDESENASGCYETTGVILDDDGEAPTWWVGDATESENTSDLVVLLGLSRPVEETVSIRVTTAPLTATAEDDDDPETHGDYVPIDVTIEIPPGEVLESVFVPLVQDQRYEPDQTFKVLLSESSQYAIGDGEGIGTITDDDEPPKVSFELLTGLVDEPTEGTTSFTRKIVLSPESEVAAFVDVASVDGEAEAGTDFQALSELLVFDPLEVEKTVEVIILADGVAELPESFDLELGPTWGATVDQWLTTIHINDAD